MINLYSLPQTKTIKLFCYFFPQRQPCANTSTPCASADLKVLTVFFSKCVTVLFHPLCESHKMWVTDSVYNWPVRSFKRPARSKSQPEHCPRNEQCLELNKTRVLFHGSGELWGKRTNNNSPSLKINRVMQRELLSYFKLQGCGWGQLCTSFHTCLPTLNSIQLTTVATATSNMLYTSCLDLGWSI